MRTALSAILFSVIFQAQAQHIISGIVVDESNKPITGASVFLNTTSIGTTTNNDGVFRFDAPAGRFDLIVSSVGYQTSNQTINTTTAAALRIVLKIKATELETVVAEPFEPNGWEKWGRFFIENFIGTSDVAKGCRLNNPQVLKFRHNKRKGTLIAVATGPLEIENKTLGYTIKYQLEDFLFDFNSRYIFYAGYPFFTNVSGGEARQKTWNKRRADVYYGSMLHFMRSLYQNKLGEEGFEVRRLQKIPNTEKQRVRQVYKNSFVRTEKGVTQLALKKDSAVYYNNVQQQPDVINVASAAFINADSITTKTDSGTVLLHFENYLLITYKSKPAAPAYVLQFPRSGTSQTSEINLLNSNGVEVFVNGAFFSPLDLLTSGYWAWRGKNGHHAALRFCAGTQSR